ncbi:MAG: hypothetical protein J6V66_02700, partial [Clostridia bacterium]|nr:hypothetical protein [Clostridia bacterium]
GNIDYGRSIDEGIGNYENGRREQSVDSVKTQNGRADIQVSQMAQKGNARSTSAIETGRDSGKGSRNKQGIKFSLKDSDGNTPLSQQARVFQKQ